MRLSRRRKMIAAGKTNMPEITRRHYVQKWHKEGFDVSEFVEDIIPPLRGLKPKGHWTALPEDAELIRDTTLVIKSFQRFRCLWTLIRSIRRRYTNITIVVADDSFEDTTEINDVLSTIEADPNATVVPLPFDSGLSAGRNAAVDAVQTKYCVLLDDDYVFTQQTQVEKLVRVVAADAVDVCAGVVLMDGDNAATWAGVLDTDAPTANGVPFIAKQAIDIAGVSCRPTELALNFFAASTAFLQDNPWDERFKMTGEHIDWFLSIKKQGTASICWTPDVAVGHRPINDDAYNQYRRRYAESQSLLIDKWGRHPVTFSIQQVDGNMEYETTDEAVAALQDRPNVVILGTGRCGSTVLVQMLHRLGWQTGVVDDEGYWEHAQILEMTRSHTFGESAARSIIENMPEPWVIKQPRFAEQWNLWSAVIPENSMVILLERDVDKVAESMMAAGWGDDTFEKTRSYVSRRAASCEKHFEEWAGPKYRLKFEDLRAACELFDTSRGYSHGAG